MWQQDVVNDLFDDAPSFKNVNAPLYSIIDELNSENEKKRKSNLSEISQLLERDGMTVVKEPVTSGGFGIVYIVHHENELRAIKVLSHDDCENTSQIFKTIRKEFLNIPNSYDDEVLLESYLNDPYPFQCVKCYGVKLLGNEFIALEMQYCKYGDISRWDHLPSVVVKGMLITLCQLLEFLHEEFGIIHRDIKPHNILIQHVDLEKARIEFVLSDFGLSVKTSNETMNVAGTANFMAPEAHLGKFTFKSDVFSVGKTLEWFGKSNLISNEFLKKLIDPVESSRYSVQDVMENINDLLVIPQRENTFSLDFKVRHQNKAEMEEVWYNSLSFPLSLTCDNPFRVVCKRLGYCTNGNLTYLRSMHKIYILGTDKSITIPEECKKPAGIYIHKSSVLVCSEYRYEKCPTTRIYKIEIDTNEHSIIGLKEVPLFISQFKEQFVILSDTHDISIYDQDFNLIQCVPLRHEEEIFWFGVDEMKPYDVECTFSILTVPPISKKESALLSSVFTLKTFPQLWWGSEFCKSLNLVENEIEEALETVNECKAPRLDDESTMVQVVSTEESLPIQSDEENVIIPSDCVFYKSGISGNLYKCVDDKGEMICKFIQINDENRDLLTLFSNCNPGIFEHWKGNWFRFSMALFPYNLLEYVKINRISTCGIFTVARVIIDLILNHHTCLKNINMNNILIDYDEDMVGNEWAEAHNVELSPYFLPQSFHSENTIKAPEVHTMDDFSKQSDVYALGQVLCQLVTRSTNVNMRVSENNVQEVLRGKIPQKGIDLISQMIASDVDKRISAVDLQEHLLFTKFQFPFYFMFEIEKEEVIIARLSDVEKPTEEILQEIKKERFTTRTGAFNDWFRKKDHNFLSIFVSSFKAVPRAVQVVEDGVVEVLWFRVQSSVGIMRLRVFGFY